MYIWLCTDGSAVRIDLSCWEGFRDVHAADMRWNDQKPVTQHSFLYTNKQPDTQGALPDTL